MQLEYIYILILIVLILTSILSVCRLILFVLYATRQRYSSLLIVKYIEIYRDFDSNKLL